MFVRLPVPHSFEIARQPFHCLRFARTWQSMHEETRWLNVALVDRVLKLFPIFEHATVMDVVKEFPLLIRRILPRLLSMISQLVQPSAVSLAIIARIYRWSFFKLFFNNKL